MAIKMMRRGEDADQEGKQEGVAPHGLTQQPSESWRGSPGRSLPPRLPGRNCKPFNTQASLPQPLRGPTAAAFSQALAKRFKWIKICVYIFMRTRKRKSVTSRQSLNFLPPKPSWSAGVLTENSRTISWGSGAVCSGLLTPMSQ